MVAFFWLMTLLPSESQQPDERLSLVWTMVYALAAAFAFAFFNDDVVGRWYPFFSALAFLSRGVADEPFADEPFADEPFAAGRMSVAALVAAVLLTAIFYGMKRLLCRRSRGREA